MPKNLRVIARALARLADPAPEAGRASDAAQVATRNSKVPPTSATVPGIGEPAGERHEGGLRRPFVPALAHQLPLLAVLADRADQREQEDRAVEHQRLGRRDDDQMDDRPEREAPHHRVAGDREHAVGPALGPRARRAAPDCRRTSRRTGSSRATSASVPAIQTASPASHNCGSRPIAR